MNEKVKQNIRSRMAIVYSAINGLSKELEDLQFEAEEPYSEMGNVPPIANIDEQLSSRIVSMFNLRITIDDWFDRTAQTLLQEEISNENGYLQNLIIQSDNFLNLINKI